MAKKKKTDVKSLKENESVASVQPITQILEKNYMPYAMTVIVSRAIPEIDGFKPSHRKILYTMYKMGLLKGQKIKSANIVGQTMQLNPHGDASIYEALVRLTRGRETLLHPFIDSKGTFGKQYSRDMAFAASRYTEAKLDPFCQELFSGIDKDSVDFVPNYDNTTTEPTLLPTTFPNVLVSPNDGIAVSMACSICSFNLNEICDAAIAILKNPNTTTERLLDIIKAPDFATGAEIIYDRDQMRRIYETGTGSFKMRSKYVFNKATNCIDVLEIPFESKIEIIMKKMTDLMRQGKLREVTDVRDAIDSNGFKLTIELKNGTNPDLVIKKLFASTDLVKNFDCNFNILVEGRPYTLGVKDILTEWIKFRVKCVTRELTFDLGKKEKKLELLLGLAAILVDIDKAIKIIRNTEKEEDVVPNLSAAFKITEAQAEYVAEIKLRNINREYILKRVEEIENLRAEIDDINETLRDELKLKGNIIKTLQEVKKQYGQPRKTTVIDKNSIETVNTKDVFFENYNCQIILTNGGYLKKLSVQAARGAEEHKLKDGDFIIYSENTDNKGTLMFFTDKGQIYRAKVADFELCKSSNMGEYVAAKLSMDEGELVVGCKVVYDLNPEHHMIYVFENGKGLRVSMSAYANSTRKKISGACSKTSRLVAAIYEGDKPKNIFIRTEGGKGMLIKSELLPVLATRTAGGVQIIQFPRNKGKVEMVTEMIDELGDDAQKCRKLVIPSTGVSLAHLSLKF